MIWVICHLVLLPSREGLRQCHYRHCLADLLNHFSGFTLLGSSGDRIGATEHPRMCFEHSDFPETNFVRKSNFRKIGPPERFRRNKKWIWGCWWGNVCMLWECIIGCHFVLCRVGFLMKWYKRKYRTTGLLSKLNRFFRTIGRRCI